MAGPLSYALTLATKGFMGPLGAANGALGAFKSAAGGTLSVLGRFASPLAAIAGGAGAAATAISALNKAADFESTQVAFSTLLGSVEKADTMLKDIKDTASSTPMTFDQLTGAARSLLAVVKEEDMIKNLRRIGDLASASQKPIGDLAAMYAKIKGGDLVQGEDLNQLQEALGGKVLDEFQKVLKVDSVRAVRDLASEGKISGAVLEQVFINMTSQGGMAFQAMQAQSRTWNGLVSTLKDNISDVMLTIGTPIKDALKPVLTQAIGLVKRVGLGLAGAVDVAKQAIAQGKLGELVGMAMKMGLKEAANYGAGTFVFLGEVLFKSLEVGIRTAIHLFTGGFNQSIKNISFGLFDVFKGIGQMILAKLGAPFREVAAIFMAGLAKAVNFFLSKLGSNKLGRMMGIEVDPKSYQELLDASRELVNPGRLKDTGTANVKKGLEQMSKGFGDMFKQEIEIAKEVFAGTKFEKVNLFDIAKDKEAFAELAKNLSPEGVAKIMEALDGPTENLKDTADAASKAVDQAQGLDEAVKAAHAAKEGKKKAGRDAKEPKEGRKRIRLYDAAESLRRRFARQGGADKGTFSEFVGKSLSNRSVVRQFAQNKGISIRDALAQLQQGAATAGKKSPTLNNGVMSLSQVANNLQGNGFNGMRMGGPGKTKEIEQLKASENQLAVLKRIDGRMEKIAIA